MTSPRIAVIQPRLDGQGGLEKYGVFVIETLSQDYPVDVILEHEIDLARVERAFGVPLDQARFVCDPRCSPTLSKVQGLGARLAQRRSATDFAALTSGYELVIGQTIGLPFRSSARRNVLLVHFPVVRKDKVDRNVADSWRMLLSAKGREQRAIRKRLSSWGKIVCNSEFTRHWIDQYWARDAEVVNPPIELPAAPDLSAKRNWIVGVGFFSRPGGDPPEPWSYKRQELLIDTFRELCKQGLTGWELHLAGHVLPPTPIAHAYVRELTARADNLPVFLHPNCSHDELLSLYRHGSIYWHATGYGVDEQLDPQHVEHFGMVTAEAMGWGCVPVVINKGGQPEIVEHRKSGLLWDTLNEFRGATVALAQDPAWLASLRTAAIARAQHFGLDRFRSQIRTVVQSELNALREMSR